MDTSSSGSSHEASSPCAPPEPPRVSGDGRERSDACQSGVRLKTRREAEVMPVLTNLAEAARRSLSWPATLGAGQLMTCQDRQSISSKNTIITPRRLATASSSSTTLSDGRLG